MVEDSLFHSELWMPVREAALSDAGALLEDWRTGRAVLIGDAGVLSEAFEGSRSLRVSEVLRASEAWMIVGHAMAAVIEVGRFRDRLSVQRGLTVLDAGSLADAVSGSAAGSIRDLLRASESYLPVSRGSLVASDRGTCHERYVAVRTGFASDAGVLGEAFTARRGYVVQEGGHFADALTSASQAIIFVREAARVGEQYAGTGKPVATVTDEAWFEERYQLPAGNGVADGHTARRVGAATAWTANADTWGMSRYTDWTFNALAVVDGVLHGTNEQGLHRLDGDDDSGRPVQAHITTDREALTGEMTAGVRMLYAGAVTNGRLQATVDAAPKGQPVFYTYAFEPRDAEDLAPQRAKLGRGLKSRYWQVTVGNMAGAHFLIDTLSALDRAGQRRV
ncbi:TPA: hypothetical protein ACOEQZ_001313 [Stenotrophomonas maltophilia]